MLSVTRLLNGTATPADALRYGRLTGKVPSHLLHFSADKKPVVVWNVTQRCNLFCMHCYASSRNREYPGELTTAEGLRLLDDLAQFGDLGFRQDRHARLGHAGLFEPCLLGIRKELEPFFFRFGDESG